MDKQYWYLGPVAVLLHEDKKLPELDFDYHYHNAYDLIFVLDGDIDIFIKDTRYNVRSGQIAVIPPYAIHFMHFVAGTKCYRYNVQFQHGYIADLLKSINGEYLLADLGTIKNPVANLGTASLKKAEEIYSRFYRIYKNCHKDKSTASEIRLRVALIDFLVDFHEVFLSNMRGQDYPEADVVKNVIKFIDENYMNDISLNLLEKEFFVSKFYLCKRFKEVTGTSIMDFLQRTRIIQAQKMLKEDKATISDVCYNCGFNNLQHFYRVFRKIANTTPKEYTKVETPTFV